MKFLKDILNVIKKNKLLFTLTSIIDLAFVLILVFSSVFLLTTIQENLLDLKDDLSPIAKLAGGVESQKEAIASVVDSRDFNDTYRGLLKNLILLFLSIIIIWIIFQSINFYITTRMFKKKYRFLDYIRKFTLISIFHYLFILLAFFISWYLSLLNAKMILPLFPRIIVNIIIIIPFLKVYYYGSIALTQISEKPLKNVFKKTFQLGVKKWKKSIVTVSLSLLKIIFCFVVMILIFKVHIIFFYIVVLFFFIPSISIARIILFNGLIKK